MSGVLRDLFGPGTWGTGGNLVAWIICGVLAGLWLRAKLKAQTALARLHHQEKLDQAEAHHQAATEQAGTRHVAMLGQLAEQHAAVVKHLGKQAQHLVRQDNAIRDMKGAATPAARTAAGRRREARIAGMSPADPEYKRIGGDL